MISKFYFLKKKKRVVFVAKNNNNNKEKTHLFNRFFIYLDYIGCSIFFLIFE